MNGLDEKIMGRRVVERKDAAGNDVTFEFINDGCEHYTILKFVNSEKTPFLDDTEAAALFGATAVS